MKPIAIGLLLLVALLVGACQEERHITGAEFQAEYEMRNHQTMHSAEFIVEREGWVFLRKKTMSTVNPKKWSEAVLYTEITELDPDFLQRLRLESEQQ